MNLFNRKTLARHIKPAAIPDDHLAALDAWAGAEPGFIYTLKEVALHGQFTSKTVESVLGYHGPAEGAEYTVDMPRELHRRFKTACAAHDTKMNDEIRGFIEHRLAELEK